MNDRFRQAPFPWWVASTRTPRRAARESASTPVGWVGPVTRTPDRPRHTIAGGRARPALASRPWRRVGGGPGGWRVATWRVKPARAIDRQARVSPSRGAYQAAGVRTMCVAGDVGDAREDLFMCRRPTPRGHATGVRGRRRVSRSIRCG
jgi:hypothetical protein